MMELHPFFWMGWECHPKCQIVAMNVLKTGLPNITKMEVLEMMTIFTNTHCTPVN